MSDETNEEKKPYVAMWDYQNSSEECTRRVVLDVTPLMVSQLPDQTKTDIVTAIDEVVKHLLKGYDLTPKPGIQDNKLTMKVTAAETTEK